MTPVRFTLLRQDRGESSAATVGEAALEPFADLLPMEGHIEAMAAELGWGAGGGVRGVGAGG
ncbi:MAG TPA: hypothetical protein VFQ76_03625 [Longimicrobiaceae bacterium]|nr:hypothetical protein [Longimicrobiaceae bacterium]